VNDQQGHLRGDLLLQELASALAGAVRATDVAGRYGGDEFLVILPMTSAAEALVFINRLQGGFKELLASHTEFGLGTLSFGIAESPRHGKTPTALLAAADSALYEAKRGGRNLVEIAQET